MQRGPCLVCKRRFAAARPTARQRGYTREWDKYSRDWLKRYPFCGQRLGGGFSPQHSGCVRIGQRVPATVTDHIVALCDGGELLAPTNHQSLCTSCNTRKARQ